MIFLILIESAGFLRACHIKVDTQNTKCSFQLCMGLLCYDVYYEYMTSYLFLKYH